MKKKIFILGKIIEEINFNTLLICAFFIFIGFYFFNFDIYNDLYSNDFRQRYRPNGIIIINQIINFDFSNINFLNSYLITELITGILLKTFSNQLSFSIASNFLNIILLFFSFYFFFKNLDFNKNYLFLVFLVIFFSYKANWIYCFRKLPDIYFLFNFSLIFHFICKSFKTKQIFFIWVSFLFSIISLFVRPQGVVNIGFIFIILIYFFKKKDTFLFINKLAIIYIILYPFLVYSFIKFDQILIISNILSIIESGLIYYDIHYTKDDFYNQFLITKNSIFEFLYYYILFLKKIIYQITFLRESYSINHNFFLIFYSSAIYLGIIFSLNSIIEKFKNFLLPLYIITILALLFHSSLFIGGEPNRYQLFHLTPLYVIASYSFINITKKIIKSLN